VSITRRGSGARAFWTLGLLVGLLFLPDVDAAAAATIGAVGGGGGNCSGPGYTFVQGGSPSNQYAAPTPGVITSWTVLTTGTAFNVKFTAARPNGGTNFTTVGESDLKNLAMADLNTYAARIPVQAGDVIGLYFDAANSADTACITAGAGYTDDYALGDIAPTSSATYTTGAGIRLDVSAQLEADADGDGYGDETQDMCPNSPAAHTLPCPDTTPPETTITRGPKGTTKKTKASFGFISTEAGSSFRCKLHGKGLDQAVTHYSACTSPRAYRRLKHGSYTFSVYATDAVGNPDASPAKQTFKVKKRRKHH
jgi:hypothetical protein